MSKNWSRSRSRVRVRVRKRVGNRVRNRIRGNSHCVCYLWVIVRAKRGMGVLAFIGTASHGTLTGHFASKRGNK